VGGAGGGGGGGEDRWTSERSPRPAGKRGSAALVRGGAGGVWAEHMWKGRSKTVQLFLGEMGGFR
jgi:hypothetical protein